MLAAMTFNVLSWKKQEHGLMVHSIMENKVTCIAKFIIPEIFFFKKKRKISTVSKVSISVSCVKLSTTGSLLTADWRLGHGPADPADLYDRLSPP